LLQLECASAYVDSVFREVEHHGTTMQGHPGVILDGTAPRSDTLPQGGWDEHRCYLVGKTMFHLLAVGPDTVESRRDGHRFLDSFALSR
jgi:hypothetical protein